MKQHNKYRSELDLNMEQFDEMSARMLYFLKKIGTDNLSKNDIKNMFFILRDIRKKGVSETKIKAIKNDVIRGNISRIIEWRKKGFGYLKISKLLKKDNLTVSKSTIERYCKELNI